MNDKQPDFRNVRIVYLNKPDDPNFDVEQYSEMIRRAFEEAPIIPQGMPGEWNAVMAELDDLVRKAFAELDAEEAAQEPEITDVSLAAEFLSKFRL